MNRDEKLLPLPYSPAPLTWREFWNKVPPASVCDHDDGDDCGLQLNLCGGCGGPIGVRILQFRPIAELVCRYCGALIDELHIVRGDP